MQRLQAISTGNICPCRLSPLCPPPFLAVGREGPFLSSVLCCAATLRSDFRRHDMGGLRRR